jgi:hypothetical protein
LVSKGAYNVDCLGITIQAEKFLATGRLEYFFGFGFPLTILIASFFVWLANLLAVPDAVAVVNYMGVVFGSLCIPVFYSLTEKLTDKTTAFLGGVLLSICPVVLGYSLLGMTHAPALFLQLLAMLNALNYLREGKRNRLVLSAVCFGLLGAARFQDMVMIAPVLAYMFLFWKKADGQNAPIKLRLKELTAFAAIALATTATFYLPYVVGRSRSLYITQLGFYQHVSLVYFDVVFFISALIHNIKLLVMTLSLPGFLISLTGLSLVHRDSRRLYWLFVIWIGVPFLLFSNLFTIAPRHQILILPAFILLECYTLRKLLLFNIWFRLCSLMILTMIVLFTFVYYLPVFVYRHHHSVITDYSRWLGQVTEENAHIIATDMTHFIHRYAKRVSGDRILQSRHLYSEAELKNYKKDLEALLDQGIPVYITESGLYTYDIKRRFSNFMVTNFEITYFDRYPYEDWHRGFLYVDIANNRLFKIGKKL